MLILLAALVLGVFLVSRAPRLERASGTDTEVWIRPDVRAWVDGKPVKSYLKE